MFKDSSEVLTYIKENDVKFLDIRFTDLPGVQQHFNIPASTVDEAFFTDGQLFDGSSIRGFASIHESDMQLIPDVTILTGDLTDLSSLMRAMNTAQPDEFYNLGAISFVAYSWENAHLTSEVTGMGVLNALEAVRLAHLLVLAGGEDRYRSGVRHVGEHRTEGHQPGDVVTQRDVDELGGEGLPGARRFGTREQPELGPGRRIARTPQSGLRPRQLAAALGVHPRRGTRVLVVEVQLRVDGVHEVVLRR